MKTKGTTSNASVDANLDRRAQAGRIATTLHRLYPEIRCALNHRNPFELIVATILSAQCTDAMVNQVTPALFARFPDPQALAAGDLDEIETLIRSTGFFKNKAKSLKGCAAALVENFGGQVPEAMADLVTLPGVGRKTANVVRVHAMGLPGIMVDTHFKRLVGLLGLTAQTDPDKIEQEIAALLPETEWSHFSDALIWHGRKICIARHPKCAECALRPDCVYGQSTL